MQIQKQIKKSNYLLKGLIGFLSFLLLWVLLTSTGLVKPFFLPSPLSVIEATIKLFTEFNLFSDILVSVYRILTGFILVVLIAVPLGILIGVNNKFGEYLEHIAIFFRYIPPAAFIPLSILWFGVGEIEKLFILFISGAPWMFFLTLDSVRNTKKELIEAGYTLGASERQIYFKIIFPGSLPSIWDAMRLMISTLWTFVIVAELIAANSGLGHVIIQSQRFLQTANVIAVIIIIGILGLITDYLFKVGYKKFFPWTERVRG
ncbi:ABC transporter permease [Candidatus Woesearchaeota archaeon]|nr:ABC transporter permease [Candidatus Woesearchaeota archaeon]